MDDASPGLTHISASFVHGEPFFKKKAMQAVAGATAPKDAGAVRSSQRSASKLWHLGLEHHNPQVLEKNLAAYQDENDAARDCRTLLVARTESVPHGDSHHREGERRHADDRYRPDDVRAQKREGDTHGKRVDARRNGQHEQLF